mgnify:CR=1 FL=1
MIDFIDLRTQQARIKDRLDAGIARVLAHGQYILGPEVGELEEKLAAYAGVAHCISVGNGTDGVVVRKPGTFPNRGQSLPLAILTHGTSSTLLIGEDEPASSRTRSASARIVTSSVLPTLMT